MGYNKGLASNRVGWIASKQTYWLSIELSGKKHPRKLGCLGFGIVSQSCLAYPK